MEPFDIDLARLTSWLEEKAPPTGLRCLFCGSDNLGANVTDGTNATIDVALVERAGEARSYPECRVVCNNCGYMMSFSAKVVAGEV